MVEPSSLARDLLAKVTTIEARLSVLDTEIAEREQERDRLRASLEGVRRALDPEQLTMPLPGLGEPLKEPRRRLTAKGEELLRIAIAKESKTVEIPRNVAWRGALLAAKGLARCAVPLMVESGCSHDEWVYKLTAEGELVARALPVKEGT